MAGRSVVIISGVAVAAVVLAGVLVWVLLASPDIGECQTVGRPPRVHPDYADTVFPPNIAPANFVVDEPGTSTCVKISASRGEAIEVFSHSAGIVIPPGPWRRLLEANRGGKVAFDVYVRDGGGRWKKFNTLTSTVAEEEIDPYMVYRDMSVYNLVWKDMGIYQRNLENYRTSLILHNAGVGHGCLNCHTFLKNRPSEMLINVRAGEGSNVKGGMVIVRNGKMERVAGTKVPFTAVPARFLSWHPSGRAVAFSTDEVLQGYHTSGALRRFNVDGSDVCVYLIEENRVTTVPAMSRADRVESSPAWSPDGDWLYFVSGPLMSDAGGEWVRNYDLMRIRYDLELDTWGEPETVISTDPQTPARAKPTTQLKSNHFSVSQPQVSPDGRFLMFCLTEHGNWPPYTPSSDLCMLDLQTNRYGYLDVLNSDQTEGWHSWGSNSRWVLFSSKRIDGLISRPYLSHIDAAGNAAKGFLVPQEDPRFYDAFIRVFNRPELVGGRVTVGQQEILRGLHAARMQVAAEPDPRVGHIGPERGTGGKVYSDP